MCRNTLYMRKTASWSLRLTRQDLSTLEADLLETTCVSSREIKKSSMSPHGITAISDITWREPPVHLIRQMARFHCRTVCFPWKVGQLSLIRAQCCWQKTVGLKEEKTLMQRICITLDTVPTIWAAWKIIISWLVQPRSFQSMHSATGGAATINIRRNRISSWWTASRKRIFHLPLV